MGNLHKQHFIIAIACTAILISIYIWQHNAGNGSFDNETGSQIDWTQLQKEDKNTEEVASSIGFSEFYVSNTYGFSFYYPYGFAIKEFADDTGATVILIEKDGRKDGFQIMISLFEKDGPLTADRIRRDIPNIIIEQPQEIIIGGKHAMLFLSSDPVLGKTREVWFSNGNLLYQISSYAGFDETLSRIMATWKFKKN